MSASKHFDRIAMLVTALTLLLSIFFMNGAAPGIEAASHTSEYENRLFDNTKVHTIDIVMNDWNAMLENALQEEYYIANVVIDGETYKNVGIRTKGNTSLSTVATLGSERYSFKIEFDHYDSVQSYHGLDKLCLNNLIQDSTMMKDYLTYTMMNRFGVHSSLCSYVYITINGEDWGLYLAVEGVEESFMERNYGSDYGELYKPDSMSFGAGRGNGGDFDMDVFNFKDIDTSGAFPEEDHPFNEADSSTLFGSDIPDMPSFNSNEISDVSDSFVIPGDFDPSTMFGENHENGGFGFGGGFGMGSDDVKLQYIDDELSSYSNIWNNAKTDITEADQNRLIASLKKLSDYEDIESVVDVEQVIRYFVVHNYVCNEDSYTGSMIHNYYLHEKDGKLAMIPWDYNLAFGTFDGGNANETVNTPIDAPTSSDLSDRPMLNWILKKEEYTQLYHQYFSEFLNSMDIENIIDNTYHLIKDYVAKDPTAFYSYEEFELGINTLRQFCAFRSESISMQLTNNETTRDMNYVDASALTLSDMGSMSGGKGEFGEDMPGMHKDGRDLDANLSDSESAFGRTEKFANSNNKQGRFGGAPHASSSENENIHVSSSATEPTDAHENIRTDSEHMQMPNDDSPFKMSQATLYISAISTWLWIAVSILVLIAGLLFAKLYKN